GAFSVKNTIIAGNLVDFTGTGPDVSGDFDSKGHNLIGVVDGSSGFLIIGPGSTDLIGFAGSPLDPMLGPLQNNGGPTWTHALLAGSPAIDHGDNGVINLIAEVPLNTDQRGRRRRTDGNH